MSEDSFGEECLKPPHPPFPKGIFLSYLIFGSVRSSRSANLRSTIGSSHSNLVRTLNPLSALSAYCQATAGLRVGLRVGTGMGNGKWEMGNREYHQSQDMTV